METERVPMALEGDIEAWRASPLPSSRKAVLGCLEREREMEEEDLAPVAPDGSRGTCVSSLASRPRQLLQKADSLDHVGPLSLRRPLPCPGHPAFPVEARTQSHEHTCDYILQAHCILT